MKIIFSKCGVSLILSFFIGTTFLKATDSLKKVPNSAGEIQPILVGDYIPSANVQTMTGKNFNLKDDLMGKPAVLVFYRGGWCMYCNMQLQKLREIEERLIDLGYELIGVSPDKPEKLRESIEKKKVNYRLLSDSKMDAARSLGIAFKLDDDTLKKYRGYGINLDEASGESHHWLPVPSVFITNAKGRITFSYVNPDYKVRLDPSVLLAAAKSTKGL